MKTRTQEEIQRQIDGLIAEKTWLPKRSMFGDDNWGKIDAKVSILEGKCTSDDYYQDESAEEYEEGDNDRWSAAEQAQRWLDGEEDDDLFETKSE